MNFYEKTVTIDAGRIDLKHIISDVLLYKSTLIVLFDYMDFPKYSQAQNLEAYDFSGKKIWTAEHPTNETIDCYTSIRLEGSSLVANNFASYSCSLNPSTGKLISSVFTK